MFGFTDMSNELRRRAGRTILTALGLAAGVGLVIGIIGVSQGLDAAQAKVLAPLGSVGTDILVTRVAGSTASASASPSPSASANANGSGRFGGGGGGFFGGGPDGGGFGGRATQLNAADTAALLNENSSVVTDLSKLGKPGTKYTHDFFLSATLLSFPQDAIATVKAIPGVQSAVGGLIQLASHQTGTVPQIVAEIQTGGQTFTQTVRPDPMTDAERAAFQACVQKNGGFGGGGPRPSPGASASPGGGEGGGRRGEFEKCLPARFQEFQARFIAPLQTIRQIVNPPQTDITNASYVAAGVDPSSTTEGLVTTAQLTAGQWYSESADNEILLSSAYANKNNYNVGSALTINTVAYKVVGIVNPTLSGNTADVYFTLTTLQKLATKQSRVTQVLVKASSASSVDAVAKEIEKALPGATVVTTKSLAQQVTGSLSDAKKLADRLGGTLGVIVLVAAFLIAVLLTLSSIAKRVREIGTLRAIGWSKRRVVRQVLAETLGIGVLGGLAGVAVGIGASFAVGKFSPSLTASTTDIAGLTGSSFSSFFGQATQAAVHSTTVALKAPVHPATLALGVAFAVVGGLLAGVVGGWRAARLSPAEALRTVG